MRIPFIHVSRVSLYFYCVTVSKMKFVAVLELATPTQSSSGSQALGESLMAVNKKGVFFLDTKTKVHAAHSSIVA